MRRGRRGHRSGGGEFPSSGEDSFVAVVVTKLTGALLFILLLTMVIMALIPRGAELATAAKPNLEALPLKIVTPERLPEGIAGRPYQLALAATGGRGPIRWSVRGKLPEGLELDPATGRLEGQPKLGTPQPLALTFLAWDGAQTAQQTVSLTVFEPQQPLSLPMAWKPIVPPLPWKEWLRHGFGFLVLLLVYFLGMHALASLQGWSRRRWGELLQKQVDRRFFCYRWTVRLATLALMASLAVWLLKETS